MLARFAIYSLLIYLAVRLLRSVIKASGGDKKKRGEAGEEMVKDPNCNTYIPMTDAICKKVRGEKLYFCSEQCMKEYKSGH